MISPRRSTRSRSRVTSRSTSRAMANRSSTPPTPTEARTARPCCVETLKKNLFPHLNLAHIFVTDFASFAKLINSIGCVYVPVDHRYYNHSVGLADPTTDYSSIDIQPGYQKLCGNGGGGGQSRWRSCGSATTTPTSCASRVSRTSSSGRRASSVPAAAGREEQAAQSVRQGRLQRPLPPLDRRSDRPVQPCVPTPTAPSSNRSRSPSAARDCWHHEPLLQPIPGRSRLTGR